MSLPPSSSQPTDVLIKILIIGDMGVGKTNLLLRYIDNEFSPSYISTIGVDFKVKTVIIDGLRVKIQIWDTAGQDRFRTITSTYYRGAHGVIIVYDANNVLTFCNVQRWVDETDRHAEDAIPRILVGNKNEKPEAKVVVTQDAQRLAAKLSCMFIETSAKNGDNVEELFDMIIREALRFKLKTDKRPEAQFSTVKLNRSPETEQKRKHNCCTTGNRRS